MQTYQITRWRKTETGEEWVPLKGGMTKERAEELLAKAQGDLRMMLWRMRVEEEPAEVPAAAPKPTRKPRRPFDALDQEARNFRAQQQAADYSIRPHDGSLILEKECGDSYIVSETTCSCDDWLHVISRVPGAACKHQIIGGTWLLERGLSWADLAPAADVRGNVIWDEAPQCRAWGCNKPATEEANGWAWCPEHYQRVGAPERPASPRDVLPVREAEVAADEQYAAIAAKLTADLGRNVIWTAKDEAAFNRIFAAA